MKARKKWGAIARRKARLRALAMWGLSRSEIALRVGCCRETVWRWAKVLGLTFDRPPTLAQRAGEARALAERGLKRSAIAARLGVSVGAVDKLFARLGVRTGPARFRRREAPPA